MYIMRQYEASFICTLLNVRSYLKNQVTLANNYDSKAYFSQAMKGGMCIAIFCGKGNMDDSADKIHIDLPHTTAADNYYIGFGNNLPPTIPTLYLIAWANPCI